jgi:hypothetical protein
LVQVEQEAKREVIVLYTQLHPKVADLLLMVQAGRVLVHLVSELLLQVLVLLIKVLQAQQQQGIHLQVVEEVQAALEVVQEQAAQVFQLLSQELQLLTQVVAQVVGVVQQLQVAEQVAQQIQTQMEQQVQQILVVAVEAHL